MVMPCLPPPPSFPRHAAYDEPWDLYYPIDIQVEVRRYGCFEMPFFILILFDFDAFDTNLSHFRGCVEILANI